MPRRTLHSTIFNPSLWGTKWVRTDSDVPAAQPPGPDRRLVLDVAEIAPENSQRSKLRTRVAQHTTSPHDAFAAFTAIHDEVKHVNAYTDPTDDGEESDETQDRIYIQPREFNIFEFVAEPGHLYVAAHLGAMSRMFKRYRSTHGVDSTTRERRIVDISCLESKMPRGDVGAYSLTNVLMGTTTVTKLEIEGPGIGLNDEVQDVKGRAAQIPVLTFDVETADRIVAVRVTESGSVGFNDYPGDTTALSVLATIEPWIESCSETALINVRQSRGS